jgi:hypothetical protein
MKLFGEQTIRLANLRSGALPVETKRGVMIWFRKLQRQQINERHARAPVSFKTV